MNHRLLAFLLLLALTTGVPGQSPPLRLVQTIPMPGVEGRIDHMAVDVKGMRLFVAALGNNTLEVIDLKAGKRIRSITGLKEPQGVAFMPDSNRIVVANGHGEGIDIFDGSTYKRIAQVKLGDDSDNVRYDPSEKRIYVGYGNGAIAVIDASTLNVLARIPLPGHPESFQLEKLTARVWVNVPSSREITVVDRKKMAVLERRSVTTASGNFPMAIDEPHERLYVGCRKPTWLLIFQPKYGQVGDAIIGNDTDDLYYDSKRSRIYISCGEGFIDTLHNEGRDHLQMLARTKTAPGARTSLFVPELNLLCLAVPHRSNPNAEIRVFATDR